MLFTSFGAGRILPGISEKSASPEDLPAGSERRDFMLVYAEENNFEELVMKAQKPVLVDFFASWCGPCRMLAKELDDMASDDGYTVVKVDIDRNPRLAEQWNVVSVPTMFIVEKGRIIEKLSGFRPKELLIRKLNGNTPS